MTPALLLVRDCIIYSVNTPSALLSRSSSAEASSFTRPKRAHCSPPDGPFAINPKSKNYGPCDLRDKCRHLGAKRHLKSKRKQYMPSTSGRTAGERSRIAPKGLQRGSPAS
jgi:hypothetical protein